MKRFLTITLFAVFAIALFGCPVWSDNQNSCQNGGYCGTPYGQCADNTQCPSGTVCSGGQCITQTTNTCSAPGQCGNGENCGADGQCHAGDCSNSGCPSGYVCKLANGTLQCVGSTGLPDSGPPVDSGPDTTPPFTGCTQDSDCTSDAGAGAKCLDGVCQAAANQCSDTTQCQSGEQCVQGVCTPSCDPTHPCPTGYSCDPSKGVCTGDPTPCGSAADAGTCAAGTTCVEQHCVPDCGPGGTCANGLICVDNGCIPPQTPQFICQTEGVQDNCASGSICLHHNCYIACDPEAGANACTTAAKFNVCKQVSTSTGTYSVCGSSTNLGNQCDPTQGLNCTNPLICIDGYCR
jgi:hypothetical protein